jgi:hypothetical protein
LRSSGNLCERNAVSPWVDWLFESGRKTREISLERLFEAVHGYLSMRSGTERGKSAEFLAADYEASGAKGKLPFTQRGTSMLSRGAATGRNRIRQARHLRA